MPEDGGASTQPKIETKAVPAELRVKPASADVPFKPQAISEPLVVTDTSGTIVGQASLGADKKNPGGVYVKGLEVNPDQRGKGYGNELVDKAIEAAGGKPLSLEVRADNDVAVGLYQKKGFVIGETVTAKDGTQYLRMKHNPTSVPIVDVSPSSTIDLNPAEKLLVYSGENWLADHEGWEKMSAADIVNAPWPHWYKEAALAATGHLHVTVGLNEFESAIEDIGPHTKSSILDQTAPAFNPHNNLTLDERAAILAEHGIKLDTDTLNALDSAAQAGKQEVALFKAEHAVAQSAFAAGKTYNEYSSAETQEVTSPDVQHDLPSAQDIFANPPEGFEPLSTGTDNRLLGKAVNIVTPEGKITGYVDTDTKTAKLENVLVDEGSRGGGIGKKLQQQFANDALEKGAQTLEGDIVNPDALRGREKIFGGHTKYFITDPTTGTKQEISFDDAKKLILPGGVGKYDTLRKSGDTEGMYALVQGTRPIHAETNLVDWSKEQEALGSSERKPTSPDKALQPEGGRASGEGSEKAKSAQVVPDGETSIVEREVNVSPAEVTILSGAHDGKNANAMGNELGSQIESARDKGGKIEILIENSGMTKDVANEIRTLVNQGMSPSEAYIKAVLIGGLSSSPVDSKVLANLMDTLEKSDPFTAKSLRVLDEMQKKMGSQIGVSFESRTPNRKTILDELQKDHENSMDKAVKLINNGDQKGAINAFKDGLSSRALSIGMRENEISHDISQLASGTNVKTVIVLVGSAHDRGLRDRLTDGEIPTKSIRFGTGNEVDPFTDLATKLANNPEGIGLEHDIDIEAGKFLTNENHPYRPDTPQSGSTREVSPKSLTPAEQRVQNGVNKLAELGASPKDIQKFLEAATKNGVPIENIQVPPNPNNAVIVAGNVGDRPGDPYATPRGDILKPDDQALLSEMLDKPLTGTRPEGGTVQPANPEPKAVTGATTKLKPEDVPVPDEPSKGILGGIRSALGGVQKAIKGINQSITESRERGLSTPNQNLSPGNLIVSGDGSLTELPKQILGGIGEGFGSVGAVLDAGAERRKDRNFASANNTANVTWVGKVYDNQTQAVLRDNDVPPEIKQWYEDHPTEESRQNDTDTYHDKKAAGELRPVEPEPRAWAPKPFRPKPEPKLTPPPGFRPIESTPKDNGDAPPPKNTVGFGGSKLLPPEEIIDPEAYDQWDKDGRDGPPPNPGEPIDEWRNRNTTANTRNTFIDEAGRAWDKDRGDGITGSMPTPDMSDEEIRANAQARDAQRAQNAQELEEWRNAQAARRNAPLPAAPEGRVVDAPPVVPGLGGIIPPSGGETGTTQPLPPNTNVPPIVPPLTSSVPDNPIQGDIDEPDAPNTTPVPSNNTNSSHNGSNTPVISSQGVPFDGYAGGTGTSPKPSDKTPIPGSSSSSGKESNPKPDLGQNGANDNKNKADVDSEVDNGNPDAVPDSRLGPTGGGSPIAFDFGKKDRNQKNDDIPSQDKPPQEQKPYTFTDEDKERFNNEFSAIDAARERIAEAEGRFDSSKDDALIAAATKAKETGDFSDLAGLKKGLEEEAALAGMLVPEKPSTPGFHTPNPIVSAQTVSSGVDSALPSAVNTGSQFVVQAPSSSSVAPPVPPTSGNA